MTMSTKKEIFRSALKRYLGANKKEKSTIVDELVGTCGLHRKSILRSLRREQMRDPTRPPKKRGPKVRHGPGITAALKELWAMSDELCAERLVEAIPDFLTPLKRDGDWNHTKTTTDLLLKMSIGTMKNRIAKFQKARHPKGKSTTKPAHLKELIPIRRGPWQDPKPGDGEIDTVVHCGSSLAGSVAYTVNFTSIATDWCEQVAQLDKGKMRTLESIKTINERLPWPLTGLDPDSGSEFVNWHCYQWCQTEAIELTRSRPNHKNDNAHVEQKNYTAVRKVLGYSRIETLKAVELMNKLYAGPWRLYQNFWLPTMKCVAKKRVGSRYVRKYDTPKTPYQRALEHPDIPNKAKAKLKQIKAELNPLVLRKEIDSMVIKIFKIARLR